MSGRAPAPIGDHGLIGDTRTAALVAPDGAIEWWCLPRFDGTPVFGRLVGGDDAGHFAIGPVEPAVLTARRYAGPTATLETTWSVDGGELTVRDSMIAEVTGHFLPATVLVRRVVARGRPVRVRATIAARFGDDRAAPRRTGRRGGALVLEHLDLAMAVTTDASVPLASDRPVELDVDPARPVTVVLTAAHRGPLVFVPPDVAVREVERDERGWQAWADSARTPAGHRDAVVRSLVTLRLLTYSPSGAPVAAPTTSLPEEVGGSRNWDYRYAWPRDASLGIAAFLAAGKDHEARAFLSWLLHAGRLARPRLPVLFRLDGRPGPRERDLAGWPGYRSSRPVRVGNGAASQHQLDGYGWVVDAAWRLHDAGIPLGGETWRTMAAFADHVASEWRRPDAGIWERRDAPRDHVHSKAMAWLALDRAARLASDRHGARAARRAAAWRAASEEVADDIRRRGWDDSLGAYTAAYGSASLDAALLLLPAIGFADGDVDGRVAATVDAVRARLGAGSGALVYRYDGDDGLTGGEGAFLPCSFWLVEALARTGRVDEAHEAFGSLLALGGPLGLLAEEADPATGAMLGNHPQALTHAALVQAAFALDAVSAPARR